MKDCKYSDVYDIDIARNVRDKRHFYWCPTCGTIGSISINMAKIQSRVTGFGNSNISISETAVNHEVFCNVCHWYMIELDAEIATRIYDLNKIGFETEYCCDGHIRSMSKYVDNVYTGEDFEIAEAPYIIIKRHECMSEYVAKLIDTNNYPLIDVEFVDDNLQKNDNWTKLYVSGKISTPDIAMMDKARSQLLQFIDDFIVISKPTN